MENLRKRAELILSKKDKITEYSNYDLANLIDELNTYQIELKLQNDELLNTNELLKQSKKQYMDLYENAPVPYFTLDRNKLITESNYAAAKLLNASRITLINISFDKFLHPADKPVFEDLFAQSFVSNDTITSELNIIQNDKLINLQLTLSPYYDRFYHGKMMRLVAVDISDKKLQTNALRINEEKYRAVFEGSSDAIITIENDTITSCNRAAVELLGYEMKSELLNLKIGSILSHDNSECLKQSEKISQMDISLASECNFVKKDGSEIKCVVKLNLINIEETKIAIVTLSKA